MNKTFTRLLLPCCFMLLANVCFAGGTYAGETVYDVLCNLNAQWKSVPADAAIYHQKATFSNSSEAIQLHFTLLEKTLRAKNTDLLTSEQLRRRNVHLDRLLAYRDAGMFPSNHDFSTPTPYFIDPVNGNVCAVGHLVTEDGQGDLAQTIFEEDNNGYVFDLDQNFPLTEWATANGMTLQELAWIQPGYNWSYFEGGHMGYKFMGGCDYKISRTFYFPCGGSTVPLPNQSVFIRSLDGICVDTFFNMNGPSVFHTDISPICPTVNTRCDSNVYTIQGVQEAKFETTINLCQYGNCNRFELFYQNCYRPNQSECYYADKVIIDKSNNMQNTSPVPMSTFMPYISYNSYRDAVHQSFACYDADGDSLSYELGTCWSDSGVSINYAPGITPQQPLGSTWNVQLDPVTGDITYDPTFSSQSGIYQMCIWVKEWRNGVEINQTTFDVELNTLPMGINREPVITSFTDIQGGVMDSLNNFNTCVGSHLKFTVNFDDSSTCSATFSDKLPGSEFFDPANFSIQDTVSGADPEGRFRWIPTTPGTYFVTFTAWDDNCPIVSKMSQTIRIQVGDGFSVNVNSSLTSCHEISFDATVSGSLPGMTYAWTGNDGFSGSQPTVSHVYSIPGWYHYDLVVTNPGGCSQVIQDSVFVAGPAMPQITRTGDFLFTDPSNSYQWYLDGQAIPGATSGSHLATACGDYTVEVVSNFCTIPSMPMTVVLSNLPTAAIQPWGPTQFCEGDSVLLDAGTGFSNYLWSTGETSRTIMARTNGAYSVTITENGCDVTSPPFNVVVHPLPQPTINDLGNNLLQSTPAFTYQWNLNGTPIPNATNSAITATQYGDYTVTVTDGNGCEGTSPPFTAGNQTGIDDPLAVGFRIYPNPAQNWIRVEILNNAQNWNQILLSDLYGRTHAAFNMDNCPTQCNPTLDLGDLSPGIYFLRLKGDAESKSLKFVKH